MPIGVIFDIDGTLLNSTGVDDSCFVNAVQHVLGVEVRDRDWGNYTHSTDQGLVEEIALRELGARVTPAAVGEIKTRFIESLRAHIAPRPELVRPVDGVAEVLRSLRSERPPHIAGIGIASGAWPESARTKLGFSGLDVHGLPGQFSDVLRDGSPMLREHIILSVAWRLMRDGAERFVYVGDGVWDARAGRELGIGFIGVRVDSDRRKLLAEGAERIIDRYDNVASFIDFATHAARPLRDELRPGEA